MRLKAGFVAGLLVAVVGCDHRYKIVDVPYCNVPEGAMSTHFTEDMRYLYRSGTAYGAGPLDGAYPDLGLGVDDSVNGRDMLLAIVECPPGAPIVSYPGNPAADLTAMNVPELCKPQRVLFHKSITPVSHEHAKAAGYDGVFRFPKLEKLRCTTGTVAYTSADTIAHAP